MNFADYQDDAMRTAKEGGLKFNLIHASMGISGEAGEFADCIKKHIIYNQSLDIENACEELGDLMWFIALASETLGVSMVDIAAHNIDKLKKRYPEKYSDYHAEKRLDK